MTKFLEFCRPRDAPRWRLKLVRKGLKEEVEELERRMILAALERNRGIQARAAKELKISERVVRYKIKKYHLQSKTKMSDQDIIVEQLIPVEETKG